MQLTKRSLQYLQTHVKEQLDTSLKISKTILIDNFLVSLNHVT